MTICQDKQLYGKLLKNLAFVECQMGCDISMSYHCLTESSAIQENKEMKEILYTKVLMLCEQDKLEDAEPFMDKLLSLFPNDPYVQILKGLFEYLMEEVEDSQMILQKQFDIIQQNNQNRTDKQEKEEKAEQIELEYNAIEHDDDEEDVVDDDVESDNNIDLYDLWIFIIKIALKFNCTEMIKTILLISKPYFENEERYKIDYTLLNHYVLIYNKKYQDALSKLGKAILINDHDIRLWLNIAQTYYLLNKLKDSVEGFQRHIDECNDQNIEPNLMGMIKLIQIYLTIHENSDDICLKNAYSLIEICWNRVMNQEIYENDNLDILVSFESRDKYLIDALKYKLLCIKGEYFKAINDDTAALSNFASASMINPFELKN